jgi:hypothetical protein
MLGGAAAIHPLIARAQQPERMRRILALRRSAFEGKADIEVNGFHFRF